MSLYVGLPVLLLATFLQMVLAPHIPVLDAKPDLVVVAVVAWAIIRGAETGMVLGVVGGLVLDVLGSAPFGAHVLTLSLVAFLAAQTRVGIVETNLLLAVGAVFGGSIVHEVLFMLIITLSGVPLLFVSDFLRVVLPSAALNALIAPLFYGFFIWRHRRRQPAQGLSW